jgi:catechol 2,3-dioxygenase-like lactoylglutathione lyase family enzyme
MLANQNVAINIAVKDVSVARRFYGETLGLKASGQQGDGLAAFKSGETLLYVYKSEFAGSNKATACTWQAGTEFEAIVAGLRGKGVVFEHYNGLPGMRLENDVHIATDGSHRIVWFKDPDGNILSVVNG